MRHSITHAHVVGPHGKIKQTAVATTLIDDNGEVYRTTFEPDLFVGKHDTLRFNMKIPSDRPSQFPQDEIE